MRTASLAPLAFILRATGSVEDLPLREPTLEELQAAVGGYIEVLAIKWFGRSGLMILNEDGKGMGLPLNPKANYTAHDTAGISHDDYIVGDVVILIGREVMIR